MAVLELVTDKIPRAAVRAARRMMRRYKPPHDGVSFSENGPPEPISRHFGYDRGTPVDRNYIEKFLAANSSAVRGRVLEIGESTYSRRFGSGITQQDVLHVHSHEDATIVGDLARRGVLPECAFDCIILIQTLHLIYDLAAAVAEVERALKPGGVALVTVPGVSSIVGEWGGTWYWALTDHSAGRLFGDAFGAENVDVTAFGNVYAATCFLQGLAVEEVNREMLDRHDQSYPVTVAIRATKK